jgi:hypothetical protein
VLDGRKLAVQRPRVRGTDGHELHLESYAAFHAVDLLTDAGSGQHCDDDLRDYRKVAADDVALADAAVIEGVREPLNVTQQIGVGDFPGHPLFAVPVESDTVPAAGFDVPVQAVVGGIDPTSVNHV